MLVRCLPIAIQNTPSEVSQGVAIASSIDIDKRDEIEVKDTLHWLELNVVHQVVQHPLHHERSTYVGRTSSPQHHNTSIVTVCCEGAVDGRKINWTSLFLQEGLGWDWAHLDWLSSWFFTSYMIGDQRRSRYSLPEFTFFHFKHSLYLLEQYFVEENLSL